MADGWVIVMTLNVAQHSHAAYVFSSQLQHITVNSDELWIVGNGTIPEYGKSYLHMVTLENKWLKCLFTKIRFIPSISEILPQKCYHCFQYARRHLMSLITHF